MLKKSAEGTMDREKTEPLSSERDPRKKENRKEDQETTVQICGA